MPAFVQRDRLELRRPAREELPTTVAAHALSARLRTFVDVKGCVAFDPKANSSPRRHGPGLMLEAGGNPSGVTIGHAPSPLLPETSGRSHPRLHPTTVQPRSRSLSGRCLTSAARAAPPRVDRRRPRFPTTPCRPSPASAASSRSVSAGGRGPLPLPLSRQAAGDSAVGFTASSSRSRARRQIARSGMTIPWNPRRRLTRRM